MYKVCATCKVSKDISNFHKSGVKSNGDIKYKYHCSDCRRVKESKYRYEYRLKNKDNIRDYNRTYERDRKKVDSLFRFKRSVRSLLCRSFYNIGKRKFERPGTKTESMLGCSILDFHKYIESLFLIGMTWDNRNLWDIDHIKPLSTAKTFDEVIILNHYTNLQPLWTRDNVLKKLSDKKKWN